METPFYKVTESGEVGIKFRKTCPIGYSPDVPPAPEQIQDIKAEALSTKQIAVQEGVSTSVRSIRMQCGEHDVLLLNISPMRNFVRDVFNVTHIVTSEEFDIILSEVTAAFATIQMQYWTTLDGFE